MTIINYILKHKKAIISFILVVMVSGFVGLLSSTDEFHAQPPQARKENMTYRGVQKVDDSSLYLSDKQGYKVLNNNYLILIDVNYLFGYDMRDSLDITKEDYYKVSIYQPFQSDKLYKQWDLLTLLRKDYPDEYVDTISLGQAVDGKSYLVVKTLVTNSKIHYFEGEERLRIFDFEEGEYVSGIGMLGGMEQYDDSFLKSKSLPKPVLDSLTDYLEKFGFTHLSYTANQVELDFSNISINKLKDLNIASDKTYMELFKDKKSGTLVFFGDDSLERVAHLLARPDQTDMFAGTKLAADESADGQAHELTSIEDYRALHK